jgi:hypothetical protein
MTELHAADLQLLDQVVDDDIREQAIAYIKKFNRLHRAMNISNMIKKEVYLRDMDHAYTTISNGLEQAKAGAGDRRRLTCYFQETCLLRPPRTVAEWLEKYAAYGEGIRFIVEKAKNEGIVKVNMRVLQRANNVVILEVTCLLK